MLKIVEKHIHKSGVYHEKGTLRKWHNPRTMDMVSSPSPRVRGKDFCLTKYGVMTACSSSHILSSKDSK